MTEQMKNGDQLSLAQAELNQIQKTIQNYTASKGIYQLKVQNDVDIYMNMQKDEIRKLSYEECCEAGIILSRYAAYLQDAHNTEISRVNWATSEVLRTVAPQVKQYGDKFHSFEERKVLAMIGNDYTKEVDRIRMWAQAIADKLAFMANRVDAVAKAYLSLSQAKRRDNGR
jgi:hypothetical protein